MSLLKQEKINGWCFSCDCGFLQSWICQAIAYFSSKGEREMQQEDEGDVSLQSWPLTPICCLFTSMACPAEVQDVLLCDLRLWRNSYSSSKQKQSAYAKYRVRIARQVERKSS